MGRDERQGSGVERKGEDFLISGFYSPDQTMAFCCDNSCWWSHSLVPLSWSCLAQDQVFLWMLCQHCQHLSWHKRWYLSLFSLALRKAKEGGKGSDWLQSPGTVQEGREAKIVGAGSSWLHFLQPERNNDANGCSVPSLHLHDPGSPAQGMVPSTIPIGLPTSLSEVKIIPYRHTQRSTQISGYLRFCQADN